MTEAPKNAPTSTPSKALTVLDRSDDLPIRTGSPVHSGKVRSVYWLTPADSARLIERQGYPVAPDAALAVMVISDRLSAFDCLWTGEGELGGVPGKGAALNAVSHHWFQAFAQAGLARSHVLDAPHPLVWIVQRAQPVRIEAIARRYITGSMWRSYAAGEREFCGLALADGLERDQRLDELLITPSTKGVLEGIPGVPAVDDVNISRSSLEAHWRAFGFAAAGDIDHYERLLREGFAVIEARLAALGQLFVDTKFEFGYARSHEGVQELIYMDEVGTPDSSRIWDAQAYAHGDIRDASKESFRQALLEWVDDPQLLLDKQRMTERLEFARQARLPEAMMQGVADNYRAIAERITGAPLPAGDRPREEIVEVLQQSYGLIEPDR